MAWISHRVGSKAHLIALSCLVVGLFYAALQTFGLVEYLSVHRYLFGLDVLPYLDGVDFPSVWKVLSDFATMLIQLAMGLLVCLLAIPVFRRKPLGRWTIGTLKLFCLGVILSVVWTLVTSTAPALTDLSRQIEFLKHTLGLKEALTRLYSMSWGLVNFSMTLVCAGVLSFVIYRTNAPISQQRPAPLIGSSIAVLGGLMFVGQLLSAPHYLYAMLDFDRLASQQFLDGTRFIGIATFLILAISIMFIGWRVLRVGAQAGTIHIVLQWVIALCFGAYVILTICHFLLIALGAYGGFWFGPVTFIVVFVTAVGAYLHFLLIAAFAWFARRNVTDSEKSALP